MMWRPGPQTSWMSFLREEVAGAVDLRPVLHLEGDVMKLRLRVDDEIDGVVIDAAAQEREEVVVPVGDPEAQHLGVELHRLLHVVDAMRDVAELERRDRRRLAVVLGEHVVGIELDHRALEVGEHQRPRRARRNAVALLALDAVLRQLARDRRRSRRPARPETTAASARPCRRARAQIASSPVRVARNARFLSRSVTIRPSTSE